MCSYAVSRGKSAVFQAVFRTTFHATARARSVHGAGLPTGTSLTHELNLLTPNPFSAANPMMGGRVLS